nr:MAG TPA: Swt1-like HEPN [Caudoviricetes sp.]
MSFFKFLKREETRENADGLVEQSMNFKKKMNLGSPLIDLTETELRDLCRHHIDTFEKWSRRIIDEKFKESYGLDYFNYKISPEQPLIKSEIKKRIEQRVRDNPGRFPRKIDAILLEDVEYFLCRDDLYNSQFKNILEPFYSGILEVRKIFDRLIPIRNKLSHGNMISVHEAEQCICYTGDFINVYKQYYINVGKEKDYNVPVFLRIKDNLGNDIIRENSQEIWEVHFYGRTAPKIQLRSGDSYKLWVEVDSSFDSSFYEISWIVKQDYSTVIKKGTGNVIEFTLNNKNVSYAPEIFIYLVTKRDWHRFHGDDDVISLRYEKILPPIDETY